jgi:Zn-dependent protease/CBS domain-containing protein
VVGHIGGVPIRAHWSLAAIVVFVGAGLIHQNLSVAFPNLDPTMWVALAALGVIGFLVSLLLHELGHALAARLHHIATERIDLWILGGIARLEREPDSPAEEAQVALAGPTANLLLAVMFIAVHTTLGGSDRQAALGSVIRWLAEVNIGIGLFNLLPASPLDGGRIVRALIWQATHDHHKASWWTARIGRGCGVVVMVGSLWLWYSGRATLIAIFLGWFIFANAGSEQTAQQLRRRLLGHRAADVAWIGLARATRDTPMGDLRLQLDRGGPAGVIIITDGVRDVGLLTVKSIRDHDDGWHLSAGDVMTPLTNVPSADPDEPLMSVLERLEDAALFIVVERMGVVMGLITRDRLDNAPFARPDPCERGLATAHA